ncbi:MAG: hypothetical protein IKV54_05265, partial [Clostridia bacterium]|nr:hypothetical protein [Clostridia bacterium]
GIIYFLVGVLFAFALSNFGTNGIALPALFIFLGLLSLYFALLSDIVKAKKDYGMCVKAYGIRPTPSDNNMWIHTVVFENSKITASGDDHPLELRYANISDIESKGDEVKLRFLSGEVVRIYKSTFVTGSYEKLVEEIREKVPSVRVTEK